MSECAITLQNAVIATAAGLPGGILGVTGALAFWTYPVKYGVLLAIHPDLVDFQKIA